MRLGPSVCLRPLAVLLCAAAVLEPGTVQAIDDDAGSDLAATESARPVAGTRAVKAPQVVEAERYAAAAFDAYGRQEYAQAIELYEKALAAAPSADILYNIARVHDLGLHDRARAVDAYQRYLAHPSARPPRSDRVKERILELRAEGVEAPPNEPKASARSQALAAEPLRLEPVTRAAPAPSSEAWTTSESWGAGLAGAGAVAAGVGIGFGIAAYAEHGTWSRDCDGNRCSTQRGVNAAHAAAERATVATIALAAGGGLLAVGATLWFSSSKPDQSPTLALHVGADSKSGDFGGAVAGRF